jgi:hypothetical protein
LTVNPFTIVVLVGLALLILVMFALGHGNDRGSLDSLGLRSAREIVESREELEAEDLAQMLAARNERRRARGEREMSVEEVELQVISERGAMLRERERERERLRSERDADRELDQLLEATNARRRARGLPDRTLEDVRREFGGEPRRASEGPG